MTDLVEIEIARNRLAQLVRETLTDCDVTPEALATRVGMSVYSVNEFLDGERNLEFRSAVRLLHALGKRLEMKVADL